MDVKELIDSLAEFDEMEDETGLNTVKAEKKDIKESLNEDATNFSKYENAVNALKELKEFLAETKILPSGLFDEDTDEFYQTIENCLHAIETRINK